MPIQFIVTAYYQFELHVHEVSLLVMNKFDSYLSIMTILCDIFSICIAFKWLGGGFTVQMLTMFDYCDNVFIFMYDC